jgi:hypothetical protein
MNKYLHIIYKYKYKSKRFQMRKYNLEVKFF